MMLFRDGKFDWKKTSDLCTVLVLYYTARAVYALVWTHSILPIASLFMALTLILFIFASPIIFITGVKSIYRTWVSCFGEDAGFILFSLICFILAVAACFVVLDMLTVELALSCLN